MRVIAVPVTSPAGAKRRVAPDLTPLERGALTLAMLEDVLDAAQSVTGWQTWVVSPDEIVLEIAVRRGVTSVPEEKPPLASAIRQVERLATEREVDALAVLPGDLPLITTEALTAGLGARGPCPLPRRGGDQPLAPATAESHPGSVRPPVVPSPPRPGRGPWP